MMRTPAPKVQASAPEAPKKIFTNIFAALEVDEEEIIEKPKVVRKLNWADYDSDTDEE